jgi:hypothetical protein
MCIERKHEISGTLKWYSTVWYLKTIFTYRKSEEDVYSYFKANEMKFKQIYEVRIRHLTSTYFLYLL